MLKKIILTTAAVLLLTSGAIYTANAVNLGRSVINNELPETTSESSFDAENPGINFGLCAGFSDIPDKECFLTPEEIQNIIEYEPTAEELSQGTVQELEASPAASSGPPQTVTIVKTVYMDANGNESDTPKEETQPEEPAQEDPLAQGEVLGVSNTREQPSINMEEIKDLIKAEVAASQPQKGIDWGVIAMILVLSTAVYYNLQNRLKQQKTAPSINKVKEKVENFTQKVLNHFNEIHKKKK